MQKPFAKLAPLSPAEQLGALIRQHRVARNLDLHEVSDRVGVNLAQLRDFENGDRVPEPREWARLCNMVHRGLKMHAAEWRAARAQVTTPEAAHRDAARATHYIASEPVLADSEAVSAIVDEIPRVEDALAFGEAIRRARVIEGMTQDEFGDVVGVTGQAISTWERGEVMPLLSNFEKLAQLVPTIEKWRDECHDREYVKGEKPEGFTTKGRPASSIPFVPIHVTPISLPLKPIEVSKAELEGQARPWLFASMDRLTTEEAGTHYVQTLVEYKRAVHELSQYEDRLATLRANVEAAQRRNADAAHALDEAVKREVLE